jgi:hypothetical protein
MKSIKVIKISTKSMHELKDKKIFLINGIFGVMLMVLCKAFHSKGFHLYSFNDTPRLSQAMPYPSSAMPDRLSVKKYRAPAKKE